MSFVGEDLHDFLGDSESEVFEIVKDVKFFTVTVSFTMSGTENEIEVLDRFVRDVERFRADGYPASIEYKCEVMEEI